MWGKKAWKIYSSPQRLPYSDEQVGKDGVSYVAVCCSVLQCVAVSPQRLPYSDEQVGKDGVYLDLDLLCAAVCCCVLKYVAEFCRVLQIVAVCCGLPLSDEQVGKDEVY